MSVRKDKLKDAIVYLGSHSKVSALGLTKLYKLLYFSDALHLREHGESITGSEYIKYEHGPVPSRGEKTIKLLRLEHRIATEKRPYAGVEMIAVSVEDVGTWVHLTANEIATLDYVCRTLGKETAKSLSTRSHAEPAWVAARMLEKLSEELMLYGAREDPDGL